MRLDEVCRGPRSRLTRNTHAGGPGGLAIIPRHTNNAVTRALGIGISVGYPVVIAAGEVIRALGRSIIGLGAS